MKNLFFPTVLITGASSGLGRELAYQLASHGSLLILVGKNFESLKSLQMDLKSKCDVDIICSDLSQPQGLKLILERIEENKPQLVINSAGIGFYGDAIDHPIEDQLNIVSVNIQALTAITLKAAYVLKQSQTTGTIVNISSAASFFHYPGFALYSASKAYVNHMSLSLDAEMKKYNIRILSSCPGPIKTLFRKRASKGWDQSSEDKNALTPKTAARLIIEQISKRKNLEILGLKMKIFIWIARFLLPEAYLQKILYREINKRIS